MLPKLPYSSDDLRLLPLTVRVLWGVHSSQVVFGLYSTYFQEKFSQLEAFAWLWKYIKTGKDDAQKRKKLFALGIKCAERAEQEGYTRNATTLAIDNFAELDFKDGVRVYLANGFVAAAFVEWMLYQQGVSADANRPANYGRSATAQFDNYCLAVLRALQQNPTWGQEELSTISFEPVIVPLPPRFLKNSKDLPPYHERLENRQQIKSLRR